MGRRVAGEAGRMAGVHPAGLSAVMPAGWLAVGTANEDWTERCRAVYDSAEMEVLAHIKRLIVRRRYRFSYKALDELDRDGLEPEDALEAVLNAQAMRKTLRSHAPRRGRGG